MPDESPKMHPLKIRESTHAKLREIKRRTGVPLVEVADRIISDYIARKGTDRVPNTPEPAPTA